MEECKMKEITLKLGSSSVKFTPKTMDDVAKFTYVLYGEILKLEEFPHLCSYSKIKTKVDGESIDPKDLLKKLKNTLKGSDKDDDSGKSNKKSKNKKSSKKENSKKKDKKSDSKKKKDKSSKSTKSGKKKKSKKAEVDCKKKKKKKEKTSIDFNKPEKKDVDKGLIKMHRIS